MTRNRWSWRCRQCGAAAWSTTLLHSLADWAKHNQDKHRETR